MFYLKHIAVTAVLMAGLLLPGDQAAAARRENARIPGQYIVKVGGFYSGSGRAMVQGRKVMIWADVTTDSGSSGKLLATKLRAEGIHFAGEGTILGQKVSITGRLDMPDRDGAQVKADRLLATFTVADGHRGRIVGLPSDEVVDPPLENK